MLFDLSFRVNSSIQKSSSQASRDQFLWAAGSTVDHASSMKSSERLVPQRHSGKVRLGVFRFFHLFSTQSFVSVFVCKMLWILWTQKIWCQNDAKLQCKSLTSPGRVDGWQKRVGDGVNDLVHINVINMEAVHNITTHRVTKPSCLAFQLCSWTKLSAGSPHRMANQTLSPGDLAISGDAGNHWTLDYPARISRLCLWTFNIF